MKAMSDLRKGIHFYTQLLKLYPKGFQERFGEEMLQTFKDQYREEKVGLSFWINTLVDETGNIFKEQLNSLNGGELPMHKYSFGLIVSAIIVVAIILTNVVFPNYGSDDYPAVGLMYLLYFIAFGITGYLSVKEKDNWLQGTKSGAIMGFTVMIIMIATYFIIDNLFLDIVSKQPEKIAYFQSSGFNTMRDSINFGLLKGLVFGSIMGTVFGAIFGTFGAVVRKRFPFTSSYSEGK